jgi:hypothetical protein
VPRVNVRLNDRLYGRLAIAAKGRNCRVSQLVRDILATGLDDRGPSELVAAEERIAATLDRFAKDIRKLHTADQALYSGLDTFVRIFLTCIPDPPSDTLPGAKAQGQQRYQNYLRNVARNMNGDARAALAELAEHG